MDCEFDKLSKDIDEYAKNMKKAVSKGDYNLSIDSKSVEQYMLKRFGGESNIHFCDDKTIRLEEAVEELLRFGYKTIREIEDDLNSHEIDFGRKRTYIGVLRDLMIIKDCKKYFEVAYNRNWQGTHKSTVKFWKENGAEDVERFLHDYGIIVE